MSYPEIRNALKTRLEAVGGVGTVSTYERFTRKPADDPEFSAKFVSSGKLNTWWIDRTEFRDEHIPSSDQYHRRSHDILITGVYAFSGGLPANDGSEDDGVSALAFQDLLEAIANDLSLGDHSLGGACFTYDHPRVSQIRVTDYQGSIRVHSAQLAFTVEERGL